MSARFQQWEQCNRSTVASKWVNILCMHFYQFIIFYQLIGFTVKNTLCFIYVSYFSGFEASLALACVCACWAHSKKHRILFSSVSLSILHTVSSAHIHSGCVQTAYLGTISLPFPIQIYYPLSCTAHNRTDSLGEVSKNWSMENLSYPIGLTQPNKKLQKANKTGPGHLREHSVTSLWPKALWAWVHLPSCTGSQESFQTPGDWCR